MISKTLHMLLLLLPLLLHSQERQPVHGRIYSGVIGVNDVLVVNNNAQKETRTDSLGNFTINLKIGDLLVISDYKLKTRRIRYTPDLVKNGLLLLEVEMAAEVLDEVVINRTNITSKSLGIPMGKAYTVQQRRLRTGSSDPVGLLINILSGRYAMLKKNVELEKRIIALEKLDILFDNDFYIDELKLTKEQANGFKYYAVENKDLRSHLSSAALGTIKFKLAELAEEYKTVNNATE